MSFDQNSKFNPSKNYGVVKFGARKPVLEVELNELQEIQNHARAEIVRKSIPSGVLNLGAITTLPTTPNTFRVAKQEVNVNGYLIDLPETDITLPEPPTEGERDDFVFLEAWFEEVDSIKDPAIKDSRIGEETSRRIKLNWRIRTVAGVDFSEFPEGFTKDTSSVNVWMYNNQQVAPQGGNTVPLDTTTISAYNRFFNAKQRRINSSVPKIALDDVGIYVAGIGDQTSKDILKTADGYVYAIPLFRVKRRNSGGYSVKNGNGARDYFEFSAYNNQKIQYVGEKSTLSVSSPHIKYYDVLKIGDVISNTSSGGIRELLITNKLENNVLEVVIVKELVANVLSNVSYNFFRVSDRPDNKYCNIIHEDDIIDLRHHVSLTGWNYDKLLEENFDKLLRGELRTKEGQKMLKTYHGIRKTPIDSNHVFYASFDGTVTPEVGKFDKTIQGTFYPTWTGLGIQLARGKQYKLVPSGSTTLSEGTIDCVLTGFDKLTPSTNEGDTVIWLTDSTLRLWTYPDRIITTVRGVSKSVYLDRPVTGVHIRITWNSTSVKFYVNGTLRHTFTLSTPLVVDLSKFVFSSIGNDFTGIVSDLAISNIDRGDNFATLPKDFIDGYAQIAPAFNGQRRNFSDAQTSQLTTSIAKPKALVSDRGITVEKGTGKNETIWETGDKIKVKGLAGEIIGDVPAPKVKASIDGGVTAIDVVGTWTGLGTSEATFTLGNNVNLDTEDLFIEYSLNSPSGQCGIPEVLTEVLEGEYLGQKYVKGAPKLKADFRGKVAGSIVENPHIFKTTASTSLQLPNSASFTEREAESDNGGNINLVDNKPIGRLANENGRIQQHLFSFNLIAEVERQLGRIPRATLEGKVAWLKENVVDLRFFWYGFGSGPSGYNATIKRFNSQTNDWHTSEFSNSTEDIRRVYLDTSSISSCIDNNGFAHLIAYAEPSDGVTPSVVSTDYVELEIEFKTPTGYDTLTPAEPFHNGTRKNFFFIRKETKEIEMMFNCDEDYGVITWGNYVPKQFYESKVARAVYLSPTATILTSTTAKPHTDSQEKRNLAIAHIPLPPNVSTSYLDGEIISGYGARHKKVLILSNWIDNSIGSTTNGISAAFLPDEPEAYRRLAIRYGVVEVNGELLLRVACRVNTSKTTVVDFPQGEFVIADYSLIGRPLVKGVN